MKHLRLLTIAIFVITFNGCDNSIKGNTASEIKKTKTTKKQICNYKGDYSDLGNSIIDTIRVDQRLIDPIDDFTNFTPTDFGFTTKQNRIYKKSKTIRNCGNKLVGIEYYQDFTDRIELSSYKEYDERFFSTKNRVNFWDVNSDGFLIIPIEGADPKTFKPFEDICGGTDAYNVYYGSPNFGVYKLNIPKNSKYKFIAKENNYWNSPSHFIIIDNKVYNIKYEVEKGYFCELDKTKKIKDLLELSS